MMKRISNSSRRRPLQGLGSAVRRNAPEYMDPFLQELMTGNVQRAKKNNKKNGVGK